MTSKKFVREQLFQFDTLAGRQMMNFTENIKMLKKISFNEISQSFSTQTVI